MNQEQGRLDEKLSLDHMTRNFILISSRWMCSSKEYVGNSHEEKLNNSTKGRYLKLKWLKIIFIYFFSIGCHTIERGVTCVH
jgi:hypothetical protein